MNSFCYWLISLAIAGGISQSFGQSFSHSPNDSLEVYTVLGQQVTMNITQVHPTNDTLNFSWYKLQADLPFGWTATICDNSDCYPSLVNSGNTLPVLPGDDGLMIVHCATNTTIGTGIIQYAIYETSNPSQIDTLTWIIHAEIADLSEENLSFNLNYTNGILSIESTKSVNVSFDLIDAFGKIMFKVNMSNHEIKDISYLPNGVYWIRSSCLGIQQIKKICKTE